MILIRLFTFGLAVLGATINNKPPADSELVYEVNTTTPGESHVIPNRWMVYLKKDSEKTPAEHAGWATSLHEDHSGGFRGVMNVFNLVILEQKGYNGEFTDWTVEQIRKDKDVMFVIPDEFLTVDDTKAGPPLLTKEALDEYLDNEEEIILKSLEEEGRPVKFKRDTKQPRNTDIMKRQVNIMQPRAPWGLSAISKGPRSIERGLYCYDRSAGFGTFIYILDSGADIEHADLRGRAYFGYDATSDDVAFIKQERQIQEHGTHVASIAAGKSFGVAKKATIIDVKVMREPSEESYNPSLWTVSNGIEWAIQDILAKNRLGKAVLNLSFSRKDGGIGTRTCMLWVESVMKALDVGIHVVIAAGNQDISAEMRCPGNTPRAITVGATDMQDRRWVRKGKGIPGHKGYQPPGGSNWGRLVDIFAPGHRVLGAYAHTDGFVPMTGTSMATPHVSGVIAYLLALEGPLKPSDMAKRLRKLSEKGIVNDPRDSPNYSLYNGARG